MKRVTNFTCVELSTLKSLPKEKLQHSMFLSQYYKGEILLHRRDFEWTIT